MGVVWSYFFPDVDAGRTDDPDPGTGLTSRDRYLIKTTWELVMNNGTKHGVDLFMRLFEIQPKYQQLFPFKNIPYEELPQNKVFQAHCNTVIHSFGSIVSVMDDFELLKSVIAKIGINHAKRSVDGQALKDVKQAIIDVFSFLDKEELTAWAKLLDVGLNYMESVITETNSTE